MSLTNFITQLGAAGAGGADTFFIRYTQPSSYATEARSATSLIHSDGNVYAVFGYEQSSNDYVFMMKVAGDGSSSTQRKVTNATGKNPRVGAVVETSDGNIAFAFDNKGSNNIKAGSGNPSSFLAVYNVSSSFAPVNVTFGGTSYENIKFNQTSGGTSSQNCIRTLLADGTDLYSGAVFSYGGSYLESGFSKLSGYTGGGTVSQSWKRNIRYDDGGFRLGHPWGLSLTDNKSYLVTAGIGSTSANYYQNLGYVGTALASTGVEVGSFFSVFDTGGNEFPKADGTDQYGAEYLVKGLGLAKIGSNTFVSGYRTQSDELMLYKVTVNESTGALTSVAVKRITSSTGDFRPSSLVGNEDGNLYVVGFHTGNNKPYVMQINSALTSVLGAYEWFCVEQTSHYAGGDQGYTFSMSCSETAVAIPFFQWTQYSYRGGMGVMKLPVDFTTMPTTTNLSLDNGFTFRLQEADHGTVTFNNETPTFMTCEDGYTQDAVYGSNDITVTTESTNINDDTAIVPE